MFLHELEPGYAGEFNAIMNLSWGGCTLLYFYKLALDEITQAVKANVTSSNEGPSEGYQVFYGSSCYLHSASHW